MSSSSGSGVEQGKLLAWNPATFQNTVLWRGAPLTNVPVLAGPAALSFAAGQQVALIGGSATGGASSVAILGSWVTPGAAAAAAQIQFMQTTLAKQISAEIFAERIQVQTVADEDSTTSLTFVSLSPPGPAVSDVEVVSGVALAFVSSRMDTIIGAGPAVSGGYVGIEVSGATAVAPVEIESALDSIGNSSGDTGLSHILRMTALIPFTGLNPGTHTFTLRYRSTSTINDVFFSARSLAIVAL